MASRRMASIIAACGGNAAYDGAFRYTLCYLLERQFCYRGLCVTNDNWGWRARIGMFIVGNEAVPEAEWWAMAPEGVSVHAARVTAKSPWPLDGDLKRGAGQFATMKLTAVVLGHTTSSIIGGKGWDEKMSADLTAIIG